MGMIIATPVVAGVRGVDEATIGAMGATATTGAMIGLDTRD